MAKFDKSGASKSFGEVSKKAAEKATVITIQNINTENILDNPENGEDVNFTEDLELSMQENGFTDPLEVTDFEQEKGKYMILSGHRRRYAGIKVGISVFPCLVRHFRNKNEVKNYMLSSNAQRDSAKDPFLFSKRYKMHEQYLIESGFKGSIREEVAKRLGLSVQQADRYNTMNKIILPVWDMVRAENVGMSSVQPMAIHTEAEQQEIFLIMDEALKNNITLTRDTMKKMIDSYRTGIRTWAEMADILCENGILLNTKLSEIEEPKGHKYSNEVTQEFDNIFTKVDEMDIDETKWEQQEAGEMSKGEDINNKEVNNEKKQHLTEKEKQTKRAKDIISTIHKLNSSMTEIYKCENEEDGIEMFNAMGSIISVIINEMRNLSEEYGKDIDFSEKCKGIQETLNQYI